MGVKAQFGLSSCKSVFDRGSFWYLSTTVSYIATVSGVRINSAGYTANVVPGGQFTLALTYSISDSSCPDCIDQIEVGLDSETGPQQCAYNGIDGPNGASGSASVTLNAPREPGRYYIAIDRGQAFGCDLSHWWNGPRSPVQYIGLIDVHPSF